MIVSADSKMYDYIGNEGEVRLLPEMVRTKEQKPKCNL